MTIFNFFCTACEISASILCTAASLSFCENAARIASNPSFSCSRNCSCSDTLRSLTTFSSLQNTRVISSYRWLSYSLRNWFAERSKICSSNKIAQLIPCDFIRWRRWRPNKLTLDWYAFRQFSATRYVNTHPLLRTNTHCSDSSSISIQLRTASYGSFCSLQDSSFKITQCIKKVPFIKSRIPGFSL